MRHPQYIDVVDPDEEWKKGIIGTLLKWKQVSAAIGLDITGGVVAYLYVHWTAAVLILGVLPFVATVAYITRRNVLVRLRSDKRLHLICHETRDDVAKIAATDARSMQIVTQIEQFHQRTVDRVSLFFRELLEDPTANCVIRLASISECGNEYVTKARSDGLENATRTLNTEPLPFDKGLAAALRSKDFVGVYIIHEIVAAIEAGIWMRTKNDDLKDLTTLMVAPINGYESTQKVMLGILYVCSKKKDVFSPGHALPLKAVVDLLGTVYPSLISRAAKARKPKVSQ